MIKLRTLVGWFTLCCLAVAMSSLPEAEVAAQIEEASGKQRQKSSKTRKRAVNSTPNGGRIESDNPVGGQPILWAEPLDIERRDLFHGPGGRQGAPDPKSKFTFIRHSKTGTQKKIIVKDERGREWTVKFGPEAKPETTATRVLWAVGYHVDQNYFVKRARIEGYETPDVSNVRFERRDDGFKEVGTWSWESNPFVGTRELQGLKVLTALLKNWDLKTSNNKIAIRNKQGKNPSRQIYYVADLGATFGATGSFLNQLPFLGDLPPNRTYGLAPKRGKGDPEAFAQEAFIKEVRNDEVVFNHERTRGRKVMKGVTVENARWMGNLLARLSDKQLADAFRAGGFNASETSLYVRTMRERIRQLQELNGISATRRPAAR